MKQTLFFILILFLFTGHGSYAQLPTDEEIGMHFYKSGEYDKALAKFEPLFFQNPESEKYYSYYLNCLINLKEFSEAESVLKKLSKKYPLKVDFLVDLGYIYKLEGNEKKKNSVYEGVLKNLKADENSITATTNAFKKRNEYSYAIQTIIKGRKLLSDEDIFAFTLAELYNAQGDIQQMMNEYMRILNSNPDEMSIIQDKLQDLVLDDKNYNEVKEFILKIVQESNYNIEYVNLFTWLLVQRNDYSEAFKQQKALDKRYGNNNPGLFRLAQLAISGKYYSDAKAILQYIIDKGRNTPYFYQSKFGMLDIDYYLVTENANPAREDILALESSYSEYLKNDFYKYVEISEKLIGRLAEIKAIYLDNVNEAIKLLERYIIVPQVSNDAKARMKIQLGDYYVLKGDIWEATLIYAQVDKMYPDNPIGHEAKFRNARLSFYKGEFEWATDQLDVLKASTSELIANDALQLSLLIQDNQKEDSADFSLEMYARADFFVFKNKTDSAEIIFDSILKQYPNSSLVDDILYTKGNIELKKKNFPSALAYYEKVYTLFNTGILADDAVFKAATINENYINNKNQAQLLYEKLILEYAGSIYADEARIKFRKLRGDIMN